MAEHIAPFTVTRLIQELQTKPGNAVVRVRITDPGFNGWTVDCAALQWDSEPDGETVTLSDE